MFQVAIVGGGYAGRLHLRALATLPNVRVEALVDPIPQPALLQQYAIRHQYADLEELLTHGAIEAVCLATPPALHFPQARRILEAGLPLLLEKPVCLGIEEAERLVKLGRGRRVLVGHNLRHHRLVAQARQLVGKLGSVRAVRSVSTTLAPTSGWKAGQDGQLLSELGTHHFDLMRSLLALEIEFASAVRRDAGVAYQGCAGEVLISSQFLFSHRALNQMEIDFERGRLSLDFFRFDGLSCSLWGRMGAFMNPFRQLPPFLREGRPYGGDFLASYRNQWLHFMDCVQNDLPCSASLEDGREALRCALLPNI